MTSKKLGRNIVSSMLKVSAISASRICIALTRITGEQIFLKKLLTRVNAAHTLVGSIFESQEEVGVAIECDYHGS